jgi:apolipoprotein N-acyltransferase
VAEKEKIGGEWLEKSLKEILDLSLENADQIDYLVWPESALPQPIFYGEKNRILKIIGDRIGRDRTLITGALRIEGTSQKIYNSLVVLRNSEIVDYYDKYHLAPFGEFIPFSNIFKFMTSLTGIGNFSKARIKNKIIKIDDRFPLFSPSICYESIFIDSVNKKKGARLIVNITNDAWLGRTSGPYQHFAALKFRALENHLPAIRVANSGISGIIDKHGRVLKKIGLGKRGILDVSLPIR